ncbi:MAG: hypothetical protein KF762_03040 [Acidobacteria bacterium]|nr:hypothetical protein [Acidobacteriota bacterium]
MFASPAVRSKIELFGALRLQIFLLVMVVCSISADYAFSQIIPTTEFKFLPDPSTSRLIDVRRGRIEAVEVSDANGFRIQKDRLKAELSNDKILDLKIDDGKISLAWKNPSKEETLTISVDGSPLASYKIRVLEELDAVESRVGDEIILLQNSTRTISVRDSLVFYSNFTEKRQIDNRTPLPNLLCETTNTTVARVDEDCETLSPGSLAGITDLRITHPNFATRLFRVRTKQVASSIVLSLDSGLSRLEPRRDSTTVRASLRDSNGNSFTESPPQINWTVVNSEKKEDAELAAFVNLSRIDNSTVTVRLSAKALDQENIPGSLWISGCIAGQAESTGCDHIQLELRKVKVTGFRPLRIRLDVLDDLTAKDLFGKRAAKEYFIAKVRLFNEIGRDDLEFGKSILVYSESLEVNVAVEYRQNRQIGDDDKAAKKWRTVSEGDFKKLFGVDHLTAYRTYEERCVRISQKDMKVPYRPLTFEMVLNTQDRRDSRSLKSKILLIMNGASSLTSFVTSIAVPGAGSDLPIGLEKFNNLLIPSFQKLFPSLNEVQRQNITSMVMRPLEEIPFGSDITRVLFFPKKSFSGVLPNGDGVRKTEIRISAISIADACAEVGIIEKASEAKIR